LCKRAYGKDLEPLFATFQDSVHVLAFYGEILVSHALWVTRHLQPGDGPILKTAYVEMVATAPEYQGSGLGRQVMRALAGAITGYNLSALCPADTQLYEHLGWEYWRGPLFIRHEDGLIPTPDERVMILRLPKTPSLDLNEPLSAEWRPGELW
jgi:aminoglycoside 2'-N-acetyltransferase I